MLKSNLAEEKQTCTEHEYSFDSLCQNYLKFVIRIYKHTRGNLDTIFDLNWL